MSLVCAQCSRVNPPEAAYCYHDGAALAGRAGGPINPGSAPFGNPFVFPNGQACRNFDQLAMTCQQNWSAALDLLKQGFLAAIFGGLGRVDLALAGGFDGQENHVFEFIDDGGLHSVGLRRRHAAERLQRQHHMAELVNRVVNVLADFEVSLTAASVLVVEGMSHFRQFRLRYQLVRDASQVPDRAVIEEIPHSLACADSP